MADIFDSIAPDKGDIFDRITPPKEDIFDKIKGVGEGIATTALGATTWIPTGIANVADMGAAALSGQTPAFEMGKNVEQFFAYEPKTKVGKAITSAVQYPFKKLGEFQQAAGEKVYEVTGSPVLAAGTETAIGAIPFVAPVAVGKGISKVKGELKSLEGMKGVVAEAKGDVSIKPEVKLDIFDKVEAQAKPEIVEPAATSQGKNDIPGYQAQADALGIKYNGIQRGYKSIPDKPMFTADIDGVYTTFMLDKGETLPQAIARKQKQKAEYEARQVKQDIFMEALDITTDKDTLNYVLSEMKSDLQRGEAGGLKGVDDFTGEKFYQASGHSQWYRDLVKEYANAKTSRSGKVEKISAKEVANIIDKGLKGDKLTDRQLGIWERVNKVADSEAWSTYKPLVDEYQKAKEYDNVRINEVFRSEEIDPRTAAENHGQIVADLERKAIEEGIDSETAFNEVNDFFASVTKNNLEKHAEPATIPNVTTPKGTANIPAKDKPQAEAGFTKVFRGEYQGNKKGNYYSPDVEFARQFTQSGLDKEIIEGFIKNKDIYRPNKDVYAGDPDAIDVVIKEARNNGFKAVELSEGVGQPKSIYVFDKVAIKSTKQYSSLPNSTRPPEVGGQSASTIHPEVQKALQEPTPIPTKEAVATKIQTKQTLEAGLGSGDIPANTPVRLTTVDELRSIIKNDKLFVGKDAEGYDVISAQNINQGTPIVGYGANNKISAAIIFDGKHVEAKGMAPNEVSIRPNTPVKDLRFVIDGHEKILTFDELKNLYKEKPAKSETVAKTPELPPDAEMQPHRTAQRVEAEAISKELLNREGLGEDIAKYEVEKGMMDRQAQLGVEIMDKDWNSAVKMALGEIPPPEGVRPGTMITAVSKRAMEKGDYETVYQLGTNEKSYTIAQEVAKDLKSFDQGLSDNPVTAIRSIVKARKEENAKTGVKVDTAKQNAEIERLNKALEETQKKLDEHIAQSEKKQPIKYGSTNKIVTESEYLKAKQELRAKLGSQLSAGIDPTIAAQLGKIGAYHLEAGARSFAVWSERVIVDVGDWVKPHLKELYKQATETVKNTSEQTKLKRFKTRLQSETKQISDKFENLEFEKQERQPTKLDAEGRRLKDIRDRAKLAYDTAVRKTGTVTREEAAKLLDLARKAAELKSKHDPNVKTNHGWPSTKERLEYGRAQVAFERYVAELKEGDMSLATLARRRTAEFINTSRENPAKAVKDLAVDTLGEISDSSIALVASLDNSFIGRQGLVTLQTHPTVWAKAAMKSFSDIYKALRDKHGNEVAKDILRADLVSRENYLNGNYQQSGILAKFEEQYPTSHPSRIPVIGRAFKASEVAFTNTALRMRIGTFDLLLDMAKKEGLEIDKAFIKDIGAVVNSATARAKTHDSKFVKNILWAPKMMLANVNILTGHGLGAGLKTGFARKQAAFNLMKIVGETAAVVAVLNALKPDAVELDPRSSDFMKYRDGNTRIDLTAGRGQYITLTARWLTGQTKNAQTKIIKELNLGGFGKGTYFDVGLNFLINKTTPTVRQGISIAQGKNFEGKKPTIASTAVDLVTPIPVKNFYDNLWGDYPDKSATALIGAIADVFGVNANTYQPLAQWDNSSSKELKEFRRRVGEDRFQKANILYNNRVNAIIERVVKTPRYERLSDDDKQKLITQIRRQEKNKIIGK